jgi:protein involved in polysaccharide export with SLBB domain
MPPSVKYFVSQSQIGLVLSLNMLMSLRSSSWGCAWVTGLVLVSALTVGTSDRLAAQTATQLAQLRQNPELVQRYLQQSGMTPEQIRAELRARGYPPSLLDPFLSDAGAGTQGQVTPQTWLGLEALGLDSLVAEGLESIDTQTGFVSGRENVEPDTGLQLFGSNAFRRSTLFQPILSGPVPPNYRLGPGDALVLVLTGDVELAHELNVTREGFVVIPQVGQLMVNNLTMERLEALLRRRLGRSYSGIRTGSTRFDVTVARLRTNQVFVNGEVVQPGAYQLSSVATVMNALYAAGGPTERANFREVAVRRRDSIIATLDVYRFLLEGSTQGDVMLEQGDVVFVPTQGRRVTVTGAVIRPAIYEITAGETLTDAIRMAGGFRSDAALERLSVYRALAPGEGPPGPVPWAAIDVPLLPAAEDDSLTVGRVRVPALSLENGDRIAVDSLIRFRESLYVTIGGMVTNPGAYPWREGITVRDLMLLARGPRVGADLNEAEIARLPEDRRLGELATRFRIPLDSSYLYERDASGAYVGAAGRTFPSAGSAPEVVLEPFDAVTIFRQPEFELQRTVWITGEVLFPGPYALTRKDERVSDLVERAGGMLPTAYVSGARFFRRDVRGFALGDSAETQRVNLELESVIASPGGNTDIMLQPNDSLMVPEYDPTVRIEGAVTAPASVLYVEGADLDYYIANAGGYARSADKGRVAVQAANGSASVRRKFLFFSVDPEPGPGSFVYVPPKPEAEPFNTTQFITGIASLLTSVVAIIAIASR